jgi:hypothetical protein
VGPEFRRTEGWAGGGTLSGRAPLRYEGVGMAGRKGGRYSTNAGKAFGASGERAGSWLCGEIECLAPAVHFGLRARCRRQACARPYSHR